jgi:hypothetical protein
MTQPIAALPKLARHHPLHPAVVVLGILVIAATAKLGHGMWGISGLLAFYPAYLAMLAARRSAAPALSRLDKVRATERLKSQARGIDVGTRSCEL